nr:MAG TPA: hypothetical protein [Crassvirales sp.]
MFSGLSFFKYLNQCFNNITITIFIYTSFS